MRRSNPRTTLSFKFSIQSCMGLAYAIKLFQCFVGLTHAKPTQNWEDTLNYPHLRRPGRRIFFKNFSLFLMFVGLTHAQEILIIFFNSIRRLSRRYIRGKNSSLFGRRKQALHRENGHGHFLVVGPTPLSRFHRFYIGGVHFWPTKKQ